jgi:hypothetical protein
MTTFTTHSTTNSPSKHHVVAPVFRKNPCKNGKPTIQGKILRATEEMHTKSDEAPLRSTPELTLMYRGQVCSKHNEIYAN